MSGVNQVGHHSLAARGLVQTFGLDIRAAMLAVIVDVMANGISYVSFGVFYLVELLAAFPLAFIVYKIQRSWYGDDHDSALIKALIVGLLTAIPAPITPIIALPGGALGLIRLFQRKRIPAP
jgi:hypothetical protein